MIYLNSASTNRPTEQVLKDFMWCAENCWANPSDISQNGIDAKRIILHAQEQVASHIGAKPNEIIFTSGGSESNNWAIKGYLDRYPGVKTIITTKIEHPSIYNTCQYLGTKGYRVEYAPIDTYGKVKSESLENLIAQECLLYPLTSIMMANNEIGTINDIAAISKVIHKYGGHLHVDAVQAFGQVPINVKEMGIDMMSVSFHKFGGFKGCGFLYVKEGIELSPLIHGGHQFNGWRAGTENVPMIYALGNQVDRMNQPTEKFDSWLLSKIYKQCGDFCPIYLNGDPTNRLPRLLSLTFEGIDAEALITLLDQEGVCVSAGSACNAGSKEPSRILKAINLSDTEALSTIRISWDKDTLYPALEEFLSKLRKCLEMLKMME